MQSEECYSEKVPYQYVQESQIAVVGLPGFEPGSIEPKSTSLDQTSRQPPD